MAKTKEPFVPCQKYDDLYGYGRCSGTREWCSCGGNKLKCSFFEHCRKEAKKELHKIEDIPYERLLQMFKAYIDNDISERSEDSVVRTLRNVCKCNNDELSKLGITPPEETVEEKAWKLLREKIKKELEEYRAATKGYSNEETYNAWYQTAFVESYYRVLTNTIEDEFYDGVAQWLLKKDKPLHTLYDMWFNTDEDLSLDSDVIVDNLNAWYSYYQGHEV